MPASVRSVEQDFGGEALERRPWANKREDRPKGAPTSSPQQFGFGRDVRRERGKRIEKGAGNYRSALHRKQGRIITQIDALICPRTSIKCTNWQTIFMRFGIPDELADGINSAHAPAAEIAALLTRSMRSS